MKVLSTVLSAIASAAVLAAQQVRLDELRCSAFLQRSATPVLLTAGVTAWLDPAEVDRIDLQGAPAETVLLAHFGNTDCPLTRPDRSTWRLSLVDGRRKAWREHGRLDLVAQRGSATTPLFTIEAVPERLELAAGGAFTVVQRKNAVVPGSRGWLLVQIDDITGAQTLLEVKTADGRTLVERRSVGVRDQIPVELRSGKYVIVCKRLVNFLIGDDFAELEVVPAPDLRPDPVALLLHRIAKADLTFVREGRDYTGAIAAAHLRLKLDTLGREVTVAEFIDEVAGKSGATGKPYEVRSADGKSQPMRDWLRAEQAAIEAAEQKRRGAGK